MEKEESSGEKLEGLPKQEVSGIHGDRWTSAPARPALPPCSAELTEHQGTSAAGDPALCWLCHAVQRPCPMLSASSLLAGAQLLLLPLCVSCGPGQRLPQGELRGIEGWGQPGVLALALGFRSHVGPSQRSQGRLKRNGPGGEEEQ